MYLFQVEIFAEAAKPYLQQQRSIEIQKFVPLVVFTVHFHADRAVSRLSHTGMDGVLDLKCICSPVLGLLLCATPPLVCRQPMRQRSNHGRLTTTCRGCSARLVSVKVDQRLKAPGMGGASGTQHVWTGTLPSLQAFHARCAGTATMRTVLSTQSACR